MIRTTRRSFITLFIFGFMTCLSLTARASDHDEHERRGKEPLKGTWQNMITPYNCSTGVPAPISFPALASFSGGGTSLSMGSSAPPASRTHVFGVWTKTGRRTYDAVGLAFTFDPVTGWTGSTRITNTFKVGSDLDSLTGTTLVEVFDRNGVQNPNATQCATLVGQRLK